MKRYRGVLLLGLPVLVIAGLVVGALGARSGEPTSAYPRTMAAPSLISGPSTSGYAPSAPPRPREEAGRAADRVHAHTAYQNYRTAVASGNPALERAMKSALGSQRDSLIAFAEQELKTAPDEPGRQVARKTLESLRR